METLYEQIMNKKLANNSLENEAVDLMDLLYTGITEYLMNLIAERDTILKEMELYADKHDFPIIGPLVGQFLMQYAKLVYAKRILELGSGYGYSAMWFAKATSSETTIICTDNSEHNKRLANEFFTKAHIDHRIIYHVGNALDILNSLEGEFDIILNDIDKDGYPQAFNAALPKLRTGGLMITDNTLWSARVLENPPKGKSTKGVQEYNKLAFNDPRVLSMLIPIRDGVTVSLKL